MSAGYAAFDGKLERAMRAEASRFQPIIDASRIERAAAAKSGRPPVVLLVLPIVALIIGVAAWAGRSSVDIQAVADSAPPPSAAASFLPAGAPIGLADCQIAPADSAPAFAGWTTLSVLHVGGGKAAMGQPIYAVVTRGLAEWIGWQSSGGAMYPRPVGRMGCIYDPTTGESSLVGVPLEWEPPPPVHGLPDALAGRVLPTR